MASLEEAVPWSGIQRQVKDVLPVIDVPVVHLRPASLPQWTSLTQPARAAEPPHTLQSVPLGLGRG